MPPTKNKHDVSKPGVDRKHTQASIKNIETPRAAAEALPEEQKDLKAGANAQKPDNSFIETPKAAAEALPEERKDLTAGADAQKPDNSCVEKSKARVDALKPEKCETETLPKAGADALKPEERAKEIEMKENENQLQLKQMMNEMIALREQMNSMNMEKTKLMTIINEMKEATTQAKTEADAKVKADAGPKGQDNSVIDNLDNPQSDEEESGEKKQDDPEEQEDPEEDEQGDQCTPVPSDEEDEVMDDSDETNMERAKRLDQLKKMKTVEKNAKIARKVVIKARLDRIDADLIATKKAEDDIDSKITDSENELSEMKKSLAVLEQKHREHNSRLKEQSDTMQRMHVKELNALQEDHIKQRAEFEKALLEELESVKVKQKVQKSTLNDEYDKKRASHSEIQKSAEQLKCKERDCIALKAEREGKHEENRKLREKQSHLKKQYESLSLRLQSECKQKQEKNEKEAEGWARAVGRKSIVKVEKTAEIRRIPKYTLPHIAPRERYQQSDRMPCPSWITRVARNTQPCPLGKSCNQLLRGCNQYHKDADMMMAFKRGVRPVGWTEKFENNIRSEIEYWNGRNHIYPGLIPDLDELGAWIRKPDTEDEKRNELRRIARLMDCLQARKAVNVDGPGGPAEGNSGAYRGRGPRVVQGKRKSPDNRGSGGGRGRGQARGRGGGNGVQQLQVRPAQKNQPGESNPGKYEEEEEVDYESGEDNAGESVP